MSIAKLDSLKITPYKKNKKVIAYYVSTYCPLIAMCNTKKEAQKVVKEYNKLMDKLSDSDVYKFKFNKTKDKKNI